MAFLIYFAAACILIYKTDFFGIFRDEVLSTRFYLGAFLVKTGGILLFYIIYKVFYGSIDYGDTFNFMHDSRLIYDISQWDFIEFLKVVFGLQDESENTELYRKFIQHTSIWNKNPNELLYNDNRLIIRLHAMFHFISFHSYFVHSLFGALMSLIGIHWIYKAFKELFRGKEVLLFLVFLLFPGTLFWTSGVLKEAPALFLMGLLLISLKKLVIDKDYRLKVLLGAGISVLLCFFFKHYTFLPLLFLSLVFFLMLRFKIKFAPIIYILSLLCLFILGNVFLSKVYNRSVLKILAQRQFTFRDMSKGGIFLSDSMKALRLPYDYSMINIDSSVVIPKATIKKGASFIYSEFANQEDTLAVSNNTDTTSVYNFDYFIIPAKATFTGPVIGDSYFSLLAALPSALYVTLLKPFFFDARNALDLLASVENVILVLSLVFVLLFSFRKSQNKRWLVYFMSIALAILIIIGLTSPNPGAIVRYRSLVAPFILVSALLVSNLKEAHPVFKFFKRNSSE
jgi:uncharacterized membrane protein